ncbi:MAG: hypothetical protein WCB48_01250 [Casimicrobiaceae bacterium]
MTKRGNVIVSGLLGSAFLLATSASAQSGAALFDSLCAGCHDDVNHPKDLVYNAAGNAAIIEAVVARGMAAGGSLADHANIAAYLDGVKPVVNMAPVPHDSPAIPVALRDIIVSGAQQHASWKIIANIVTVSPPTKGTVTYVVANGFGEPSYAEYKPFPGQSGTDAWTYQGTGPAGNTTVRTATVNIANADGTLSPAINANQHGLTGSWYEPATSGQGFEVEVFPELGGPGKGYTAVSWFTYDATAGGADHQRWYTASGDVLSGQASSALTLYRNTGGNFNAGPITSGQVVGSATLRFDSCTSGQLDYRFTDGSGRAGSIPLTRITQNVSCAAVNAPPFDADFVYSGNWYDPATSGQGITVEVNRPSGALFFAWYTYANNGAALDAAGQRWYTGYANYTAGARSIPVTLYETTGGVFDAATNPPPDTIAVGTGTLAFQDCANATLAFSFAGGSSTGKAGLINLVRVGPAPKGCTS